MTPARPGVFVSYARSDGEPIALELRRRLEDAGVPLWRDREGLEGGRDWWLQITAAIDQVEFLVLVMTPAALQSAMVRREWRYARQRGVTVYPVIGAPDIDFAALPRWMRQSHFYDLAHEWDKFLNDLKTTPKRVRVPFMVEDLPPDFVPRPREYRQLLDQLVDRRREEPIAVTAALRGAGGFGKTALARALCHDEAIQNAFDDGILWVTLGERPGELTGRVEDLIFMLSGQRPGFAGLESATAALAELLADRELLIVIDDVWDAAHAKPFLQGGLRCARLITTRLADAVPVGARRIDVDAMATPEAVALLGYGLPSQWASSLAPLAQRLGEWPLLLKLVNAALRERILSHGQPPEAAIGYVNKALDKRGLTFFDARDPGARHAAVTTTLAVSLAQLDAGELGRFEELAVFAEDVQIPMAVIGDLWARRAALDELDTEVLCERLARLSLLLSFDPTTRLVRLHDIVRRLLIERQGSAGAALHAELLATARPAEGRWSDLDRTGARGRYWHRWLFRHLREAERSDELLDTALDVDYLAAKTLAGSAHEVEADLAEAAAACPDEPRLPLLARAYAQAAHLVAASHDRDEAHATLLSRVTHLHELRAIVTPYASARRREVLQQLHHLGAAVSADAARRGGRRIEALHPLPDLPHPALVRTLAGLGAVHACAISPDGRLIAAAVGDLHVALWDAGTGNPLRTLASGDGEVLAGRWTRALDFSADGRLLAAASAGRRIWLWDTDTGALLAELAGHTDIVNDCALAAAAGRLVSASDDESARLWSLATRQTLHRLAREWTVRDHGWLVPANDQGHWGAVNGCAISADGRRIATVSSDQTVIVWDAAEGRALQVLSGHAASVTACAFSPDGRELASASRDGALRLWHLETGAQRAVAAHAAAVTACAWSDDGQYLVTASDDRTLRLWSSDGDELLQTLVGHTDVVTDCGVSSAAGLLVSSSLDGTVRVWQLQSEPTATSIAAPASTDTTACAALPVQQLVATASEDGHLQLWYPPQGRSRRRWHAHTGAARACAASADGRLLASTGADRKVIVWDTFAATPVAVLTGHRDWVNDCAFDAGGTLLASVSNDRTLRLWDLRTRSRRLALVAHPQWVNACIFGADGHHLFTGDAEGGLRRWSLDLDEALWEAWLANPKPLPAPAAEAALAATDLDGHERSINDLAIAPDGRWLVSASADRTLRRWDARSGALLATLRGHDAAVVGCAVSPDGTLIASVSEDGGIRVWDVARGESRMALRVDGALAACTWSGDADAFVAVGSRGVYFLGCRDAGA